MKRVRELLASTSVRSSARNPFFAGDGRQEGHTNPFVITFSPVQRRSRSLQPDRLLTGEVAEFGSAVPGWLHVKQKWPGPGNDKTF